MTKINIQNNYDYTHILATFIRPSYKRYKKSVKLGYQYLIASTFFYNIENIKFEVNDMLFTQMNRMDISKVYYVNVFNSDLFVFQKQIFKSDDKLIEVINVSWINLFFRREIFELLFDYKFKNEYVFFNFEVKNWNDLIVKFDACKILISTGGSTRNYHQLPTIHFKMSIFLSWMLEKFNNKLDIINGSFYSFNDNKVIKKNSGDYFNKRKINEIYNNSFENFKDSIMNQFDEYKDQLPSLVKYLDKQELIDKLLKEHFDKNK